MRRQGETDGETGDRGRYREIELERHTETEIVRGRYRETEIERQRWRD